MTKTDMCRRAIVAATAAVTIDVALQPFVRPATAAPSHPDAELLALRGPYEQTLAELNAVCELHTPIENAYFALKAKHPDIDQEHAHRITGLDRAEAAQDEASLANLAVIEKIADTPARTLEGLRFKAEISAREKHWNQGLLEAIVSDLVAMP